MPARSREEEPLLKHFKNILTQERRSIRL